MKSDKFFKWVWNLNGLVLFSGLIIAILFVFYQLASVIFKDQILVKKTTLNLAQDDNKEENWRLGYPHKISGTDFYFIALESEKLFVEKSEVLGMYSEFGGSSYKPTRSKNVLFINSITNNSVWLFKSIEQLIIDIMPLVDDEFNERSATRAISYEVINSDTNLDNKLDNTDNRTFALSKVDGSNYTEIITDYNRIVESGLNSDGELFVIFINNNVVYSMLVDLITFEILSKKPLPKVGG